MYKVAYVNQTLQVPSVTYWLGQKKISKITKKLLYAMIHEITRILLVFCTGNVLTIQYHPSKTGRNINSAIFCLFLIWLFEFQQKWFVWTGKKTNALILDLNWRSSGQSMAGTCTWDLSWTWDFAPKMAIDHTEIRIDENKDPYEIAAHGNAS